MSRLVEAMIKKHGSREKWIEHMRAIASKGGKAKVPKGFAKNVELARQAGAKGGTISRRGKKLM